MIGLYLIASHMAGDYLFQSAAMAANKLTNPWWRAYHVTTYVVCFVPAIIAADPSLRNAALFGIGLAGAHFITDSRRWRTSNPWPAMPILQDQSLHIVQIAILGALFL